MQETATRNQDMHSKTKNKSSREKILSFVSEKSLNLNLKNHTEFELYIAKSIQVKITVWELYKYRNNQTLGLNFSYCEL